MESDYFCEGCKHWKDAEDFDVNEGMCISCLEKQLADDEEENELKED